MANKSFTIIEMLVVIAIMGILTVAILLYSKDTGNIFVLNRSLSKIVSSVDRARELSLGFASKLEDRKVCGWGIHFPSPPSSQYYLFVDSVPSTSQCQDSDLKWTDNSETTEKVSLEKPAFISAESFSDILFIPPNPDIAFDGEKAVRSESLIIKAGDFQKTITLTPFGQVSY